MITFNTDNMVAQRFPFPAPVMDYILKNLQPQHLLKLYQTCKFFYAKYRQNIIRNLVIVDDGEEETFDPNTTFICISNPALKQLKDFWIIDSLIYRSPSNVDVMPNFTHCTIKKLEARDFLLWNEYITLTKAGTIQDLKVGKVYRDDDLVSVEELIAQVPNATSIVVTESRVTETTAASLNTLDHKGKISNFALHDIGGFSFVHTVNILDFLKKHTVADCTVHVDLKLMDGKDDVTLHINQHLREMGIDYSNFIGEMLKLGRESILML